MTHCLAANTYVHLMHATITHYVFVRSVSMGEFTGLSTVRSTATRIQIQCVYTGQPTLIAIQSLEVETMQKQ